MLTDFFLHLKKRKLPVSTTEYLTLLEAMEAGLANYNVDDFYRISRLCLVKSESNFDKFDVAFGEYFEKVHGAKVGAPEDALEDLLRLATGQMQPDEHGHESDIPRRDLPRIETHRSIKKKEEEEKGPPLFGDGNNPLGEGGKHEEGERTDNRRMGNRSATKAWDAREFKALDDEVELNTRSIKIALRRLRKFAREGAADEFDLDDTIASTARNAGWLDLRMRPERRNKAKVLLLFDIGGSMDPYVKLCEELFSAAKSEFKQLESFYFHNVVGDSVWRYGGPRIQSHYPLPHIMSRYGKDHKLIIVGDASMGVTELTMPGIGYKNDHSMESGAVWMARLVDHYKSAVWLNPERERYWHLTQTIGMLRDIMGGRMYPLTLSGLEQAMKALSR